MRYRKPPALASGDPLAVIAPAGRPDPAALEQGMALLGERYDVRTCRDLRRTGRAGMMAGDDGARADELAWALSDPEIAGKLEEFRHELESD